MHCCINPNCSNPPQSEHQIICPHCQSSIVNLRHRYTPQKSLGQGGFGKTYLAVDLDKLGELCVIKQLVPSQLGATYLTKAQELFATEARLLQQLGNHPQIPTLFAYFTENDYLYLVQEFIDGDRLDSEIENNQVLSEGDIYQFLVDILHILDFVHQHQTIHRDLKPENIIRRRSDGKLVLIDFGASKQLTATTIGKNSTAIGSYGYTPIEQMVYGVAHPASDLYALGATCFHLLSGIHPSKLWHDRGYEWVEHWASCLPTPIGRELEQIIDQLLQPNYQFRYQSAAAVLTDLEPLLSFSTPVKSPSHHFSSLPTMKVLQTTDLPDIQDLVPDNWFKSPKSKNSLFRKIFSFLEDE